VVDRLAPRARRPSPAWRPTLPDGCVVIASYHPSRQNTNTGKLTPAMWDQVFRTASGCSANRGF